MSKLQAVARLLLLTLLSSIVLTQENVHAQTVDGLEENTPRTTTLPIEDWSFWPSDRDRAPRQTASGASRSACTGETVIPVLPNSQYGLTSQSHPDILVYLPPDMTRHALLSVKSETDYYYEMPITLPEASGIVRISLPSEAPALAADELYQWSLVLMCNHELKPDSPVLQGWLQTQPAIEVDTEDREPSWEQATYYREAHQWYDMIATMAQLKSQNPDDETLDQAWGSMLESIGLGAIATEPIIE